MSNVILTPSEAAALKRAASNLVVKNRTGELGISHGANRFVSTQDCFRKQDLDALNSAMTKLGITLQTV